MALCGSYSFPAVVTWAVSTAAQYPSPPTAAACVGAAFLSVPHTTLAHVLLPTGGDNLSLKENTTLWKSGVV